MWWWRNQLSNHNLRSDKVCWKWVNFKCWKDKNCTYDHPEMCNADINKEQCRKNPCNLYHPQVCRANLSQKVCRWGEKCKFRHTHENVLRNSHWRNENKTPHHRIHHGPPIKNIKHHQGRYGLPDGSHQEGAYDDHYSRFGDNYRNSADFHRDWPTLREEEILRKLMHVIQMETGNWRLMDGRCPRY